MRLWPDDLNAPARTVPRLKDTGHRCPHRANQSPTRGDFKLSRRRPMDIPREPGSLPRVLLAKPRVKGNFDVMVKTGIRPSHNPATTVILKNPAITNLRQAGGEHLAKCGISYLARSADNRDEGQFVLDDIGRSGRFPGSAGPPATNNRANVIFRALEAPSDSPTVRLVSRPLSGTLREVLKRM